MTKFCGKCGAEITEDFCTSCGAKASETTKRNDVNEYFHEKLMSKKRHNGYRIAGGIIMIILGFLLTCVCLASDEVDVDLSSYNLTLVFLIPGLLTMVGGILSIISKKVNVCLLISGILYALAAIFNAIGIENISLLFIICCVYAPLNIVYYIKAEKLDKE